MTLALVDTRYKVEIDGKWVTLVRVDNGWCALRNEQYICRGQWKYKTYSTYSTPQAAAEAANNAPRSGEGFRDGWWHDNW